MEQYLDGFYMGGRTERQDNATAEPNTEATTTAKEPDDSGMALRPTTIQEAIEFFEKLITKRTSYLNNCKSKEARMNREKLWVRTGTAALDALREKAERENQKPCEYCQTGIKTISMKFNKPQTEYGKPWWTESVRDPKFCPMCGRKLEPKEAR